MLTSLMLKLRHESVYKEQISLPPNDSSRCMYAGKPCYGARAVKSDGELHRFCDEHREKASEAQRKSQRKSRASKRQRVGEAHEVQVATSGGVPTSIRFSPPSSQHALAPPRDHNPAQAGSAGSTPCPSRPDRRCKYSTGRTCNTARMVKSNGELHRFCVAHSKQAARNQSRSKQRKQGQLARDHAAPMKEDLGGVVFTELIPDIAAHLANPYFDAAEDHDQLEASTEGYGSAKPGFVQRTPNDAGAFELFASGSSVTTQVWKDDVQLDIVKQLPLPAETRGVVYTVDELLAMSDEEATS